MVLYYISNTYMLHKMHKEVEMKIQGQSPQGLEHIKIGIH